MSSPAVKLLIGKTPESEGELAKFTLGTDGSVSADYATDGVRSWMEGPGIFMGGKTLHPSDGQTFFDALDGAFVTSSFVSVQTPHDLTPDELAEIDAMHEEFGVDGSE